MENQHEQRLRMKLWVALVGGGGEAQWLHVLRPWRQSGPEARGKGGSVVGGPAEREGGTGKKGAIVALYTF
jgi:hypothetical protein